jgi:hypothetical protein
MKVNLRRIEVWDAEHQRMLVLLTNHLQFAATTISEIYRQRWQIELFFWAPKQSLRVKTFVGTGANALKIQIWTARIAILVLKYLQWRTWWRCCASNCLFIGTFSLGWMSPSNLRRLCQEFMTLNFLSALAKFNWTAP